MDFTTHVGSLTMRLTTRGTKTEGKWSDIGVQGSKKDINRSRLSIDAGNLKFFGILGRKEGYTPGYVGKHGGKCHEVWSSVSG